MSRHARRRRDADATRLPLLELELLQQAAANPLDLPALQGVERLTFTAPVTLFVGENGSGKSTLLEAVALGAELPAASHAEPARDTTLAAVRPLADGMRWCGRRAHAPACSSGPRTSWPTSVASTPCAPNCVLLPIGWRWRRPTRARARSSERSRPFLALLNEAVAAGAQVIMATRSPILLACPGAAIWSFDTAPLRQVAFEELEHVRFTRSFLADPDAYLRHL